MNQNILGSGWQFPIRVNPRGGLSYTSGPESIEEAIWLILGTAPGERHMLPAFGCGIHDFVFAPNNATTRGHIAHQVERALNRWEPRIDVLNVRVASEVGAPHKLLIHVDYRIRTENSARNLVYPFYINPETGGQ